MGLRLVLGLGWNGIGLMRYSMAWFILFSESTGKIVEVREYMNSALVREVMVNND